MSRDISDMIEPCGVMQHATVVIRLIRNRLAHGISQVGDSHLNTDEGNGPKCAAPSGAVWRVCVGLPPDVCYVCVVLL